MTWCSVDLYTHISLQEFTEFRSRFLIHDPQWSSHTSLGAKQRVVGAPPLEYIPHWLTEQRWLSRYSDYAAGWTTEESVFDSGWDKIFIFSKMWPRLRGPIPSHLWDTWGFLFEVIVAKGMDFSRHIYLARRFGTSSPSNYLGSLVLSWSVTLGFNL